MLYLLPGMGASKAMYQGAWLQFPGIISVDWPRYQHERSLSQIADRLIQEYGLTANDWIGGSSFGGMVAIEIYKKLNNAKVILIGSALHVQEIRPVLRVLAPLASITLIRWIQLLTKNCGTPVCEMFCAAEPAFINAMCGAASHWDGYIGDTHNMLRIHGEQDRVIKCPQDAEIIKGAGHLVAMTHADACIRVIEKIHPRKTFR